MSSRVHEAVKAIALCHNVTPVYESNGVTDQAEAEKQYEDSCRVYQASSPDEVRPACVAVWHTDRWHFSHACMDTQVQACRHIHKHGHRDIGTHAGMCSDRHIMYKMPINVCMYICTVVNAYLACIYTDVYAHKAHTGA